MRQVIGVYGASGFGREIMPMVEQSAPTDAEIFFIDDGVGGEANGRPVIGFEQFCNIDGPKLVSVAIAQHGVRQKLAAKCSNSDIQFYDVRAQNSIVGPQCIIGAGGILCPFVILTANIEIGQHFHANIYSYVAHDCIIGDYVTFAPSVKCNGNVVIEDYAYIGTGAVLRQGTPDKPLRIGKGAVVGMGAVVTKDVPSGATVVGNPARIMER